MEDRLIHMGQFIIFFYFITFTIGFALIFLGFYLWLKSREDKLKYFILSALSLTLILLEQAISAYNIVNGIESTQLNILLRYISTAGCALMIYAFSILVMKLLNIKNTKRKSWLLAVFSCLPLIGVTVYYITSNMIFLRTASVLYFVSILFNTIYLVKNMDRIGNEKPLIRKFIVISLLMLPILFIDTIVEKLPSIGKEFSLGFLSVMIYYIVICGISLYNIIRNYNKILGVTSVNSRTDLDAGLSTEDHEINNIDINLNIQVLEYYKITNREKEIIILLINGNTYKEISEKLVISLPTVKTHVSNIYKKLGIKNKIELINTISKKNYQQDELGSQ